MYPQDFVVPQDQGGPGAGQPIGGFGGNPETTRDGHRAAVLQFGKAPILLVHGNGGAADVPPWDVLDLNRMLLAAGYVPELIWAPSYLGSGAVDLLTPHTNNVDDLRAYLEAVCEYLAVDVVDIVAHSLGCTLAYAVFRGLERQTGPVSWGRPKKWQRIGTFVALAGAFHGLGTGSVGEWKTGGEFMTELLAETAGGGGETPYGGGDPLTPPPFPHRVTYFCATASGDFVDAQNPGTGRLAGAVNRSYNLGSGTAGHEAVKESQVVFDEFRPLLNSVPPALPVTIALDKDAGEYAAPLVVTVAVDPPDIQVAVELSRLTKQFQAGYIVTDVAETILETVHNGQSLTLDTPGMWQVRASAPGAVGAVLRTYWVGVRAIVTTIVTDNSTPFDSSLLVSAASSDPTATLYYSLDAATWNVGATVTITSDSAVSFIAINPQGIASEVVTRSFTKRVPWTDAVTADAVAHFVAGRIDVTEYLAHSDRFGFFTPYTLYLVDGEWVLDPARPANVGDIAEPAPAGERTDPLQVLSDRAAAARPVLRATLSEPQPGAGHRTVTIAASGTGEPVTVHYTLNGSIPTTRSASFVGSAEFEIPDSANQVVACCATDADGTQNYQAFPLPVTR